MRPTVRAQVLASEYAARVHDLHTYDVVSRDIIHRWSFPFVPDANLLPGTAYRFSGHCVYREGGVTLARSSTLVRDCVVGRGSTIGERTTVESSVIGADCTVGAGVTIVGCYLWTNVSVADGASLNGCICCDGVVIGSGAIVAPGCVLGKGVRVGTRCGLPRFARFWAPDKLTAERADEDYYYDDDEAEEEEAAPLAESASSGGAYSERQARWLTTAATAAAQAKGGDALLGVDGRGSLWRVVPTAVSIGFERGREVDEPVEGEMSEEEEEEMLEKDEAEADEGEAFASEVGATVRRAVEADHTVENLALEINSLKFSQNRSFADCVAAIVPALLDTPELQVSAKKDRIAALKAAANRWYAPLLVRFVQSAADRTALIDAAVGACAGSEALLEIFEHGVPLLRHKLVIAAG